ncbi:MAG: efflux RND transporter periplasmic adaptor subunit [Steroidobacteraceae bacterium]
MNAPPLDGPPAADASARSRRKIIWIIGIALLLVLAIAGLRYRARTMVTGAGPGRGPAGAGSAGARASGGGGGRYGSGPLAVGVAKVTTGDVPISINALGTVTPLATVTVHPQVTGPLTKVAFTEGQIVKAGDLLAEIDPRPFQAALDQAVGQLRRDQALLDNARVDMARYKTLLAQDSVSDQTYATQVSTVAQDEATVAFDQAAVESAHLNLSYCRITSPVAGLVGLRQVDIGNLLQASSSTIVIVTQMQPMSVLFTVPEDSVGTILQHLHAGEKLTVQAFDRSLTNQIASGTLSNSDNQIDTTTGTLKLRALFDNSKLELFPNQFVNAHLILETLHDQIIVPGAALLNGSQGSYVYLVNPDNTVSMHAVTAGPSAGDMVAVTQGLQAGQTVVVDGADQLRDGAKIMLPQSPAPTAGRARRDAGSSSGTTRAGSGSGGASSGGNGGQHRHRQNAAGGDSSGGQSPGNGPPGGKPPPGGAPPP